MTILNPAYAFLEADYRNTNLCGSDCVESNVINESERAITVPMLIAPLLPTTILATPSVVFAAGANSAFPRIWEAVMNGFEFGVVLVIVFAGASWALGHRGKAIEYLIGACCGFLLARHAIEIKDFLKTI